MPASGALLSSLYRPHLCPQLRTQVFLLFLWQTVHSLPNTLVPPPCGNSGAAVGLERPVTVGRKDRCSFWAEGRKPGVLAGSHSPFLYDPSSEAEPTWTGLRSSCDSYLAWARKYIFVALRHWHFLRSFVVQQNLMHPTAKLSLCGWRKQTFKDIHNNVFTGKSHKRTNGTQDPCLSDCKVLFSEPVFSKHWNGSMYPLQGRNY